MRVTAGTMIHWALTILRQGRDSKTYEFGLHQLCASAGEEEQFVIRLVNNTDRSARYGVVVDACGHELVPVVTYGAGNLNTQGRVGAIHLDGNLALSPAAGVAAGTASQLNVTIEPFMWLELRGMVTWAMDNNRDPVVKLVPEIHDEQSLGAHRDPSGIPTTLVK